jgi:preprotein translocase subunit SecD
MLEFARWKYVLVTLVTLLALFIALPNFFAQDPALQMSRKDHVPIGVEARGAIEQQLLARQVAIKSDYLTQGGLVLRFGSAAEQLKARDAVNESLATDYRSAMSYASRAPAWLRAIGLKPMKLGLDLRGGLYLLYEVDINGAVTRLLESYEQGFRRTLNRIHVNFTDIETLAGGTSAIPNTLRVKLPAGADTSAAVSALRKDNSDLTFSVVNLPDGTGIDMSLSTSQIKARQDYSLDQDRITLDKRVNALGVSESIVQRQGADRLNVQLPGVTNSAEVKDLLGKVATLEFRMEDSQDSAVEAESLGRAPLGSKLYKYEGIPVLLKREVIATGDQLTNATTTTGQDGPAVSLRLNGQAGDAMFRNTSANVGKRMGVVYIEKSSVTTQIDGKPVSHDVTEERVINLATIRGVFSNSFEITGLKAGEATDLALLLKSGSLSAPVKLVGEQVIGPSLGQDNIDKGVRALIIGMLAVFVFMALYYHAFGMVANAVLLANVVLLTALLSLLGSVLSLPGIAGIILTVGIAVDANVLIYERIREEIRHGITPQAAIRAGFEKAFSAILDSNVTAFIAGFVLYVIGSGPIKSFAIVLMLGILTSMFTSLVGSRALITLMYGGARRIEKLSIG